MSSFFLAITVCVVLLTLVILYRVAVGKTVFDRIIAGNMVGTNGIVLLLLVGILFNRMDMFIDIAIAYALLNFIFVIAVAKYFDHRKAEKS